MPKKSQYLILLFLIAIQSFGNPAFEQGALISAIRAVGDQMLLLSNDSTSRVLPIEQDSNVYLMSFEAELEIIPDSLVSLVKEQFSRIALQGDYLVEVLSCDSNKVVYSYLMVKKASTDMVACKMRSLAKDCYQVRISLSEAEFTMDTKAENEAPAKSDGSNKMWLILICAALVIILVIAYQAKKRSTTDSMVASIRLGKFYFKPTDATLILKEERIDLSVKEADLLELLHRSINQTVERDIILREVWGDEGDYVGRTLDVFISKLRKKLAADPEVKIMNVRGVGYRLVVG
jgi:hypothetical protein